MEDLEANVSSNVLEHHQTAASAMKVSTSSHAEQNEASGCSKSASEADSSRDKQHGDAVMCQQSSSGLTQLALADGIRSMGISEMEKRSDLQLAEICPKAPQSNDAEHARLHQQSNGDVIFARQIAPAAEGRKQASIS